jgi:hypothetical protein
MIKLPLTFVLLVYVVSGFAYEDGNEQPTLSQQFQTVRDQAEIVESYRMLKAYQVENLWKSVMDTIRQKDVLIAQVNSSIPAFEKEIHSLRNTLQQKESAVADMEFAGTHITVFGWDLSKAGFINLVVITFLVVLTLAAIAFWAFRVSYQTAHESRRLYDDVCKEFDAYKHKVVEKEVKLLRELQDYRNRMMELKSA